MALTNNIIVATAYCAPIGYYQQLLKFEKHYLETNESFVKQTYRNRCYILTANGKSALTVPVHYSNNHKLIQNVQIAYEINWVAQHQKALTSAYANSPFFEYYKDDFFYILKQKPQTLIELNNLLHRQICRWLAVDIQLIPTQIFQKNYPDNFFDFRHISPKLNNPFLQNNEPYTQTFADRFGFVPNLSIVDLLFNQGKYSTSYLQSKT